MEPSFANYNEIVNDFYHRQLASWTLARDNMSNLSNSLINSFQIDNFQFEAQYNPARKASTGADVSQASIAKRPCFLCAANRPKEQMGLGNLFRNYTLLVNPFPILPYHFTIASKAHTPQRFTADVRKDFFELVKSLPGYVVFFNGAESGASAPDHLHFQAVPKKILPLIKWLKEGELPYTAYVFTATTPDEILYFEDEGAHCNIFGLASKKGIIGVVVPRKAHRPDFYGIGPGQMLISPGCIDLGGIIVLPRKEDFEKINIDIIRETFRQTCYESKI